MTGVEEGTLLKLNGTSSTNSRESCTLFEQQSDILFPSLWHARFGHINYDKIKIMKRKVLKVFLQFQEKINPMMIVFWENIVNNLLIVLLPDLTKIMSHTFIFMW